MKLRKKSLSTARLFIGTAILCGSLTLAPTAIAGQKNPRVIPPQAHPAGQSYGVWAGKWWNWAAQFSIEQSPLLDQTGEFCALGQEGHVWFLAGNFGGLSERTCTVPTGKMIFFPIVNGLSFVPGFGATEEEVRDDVEGDMADIDTDSLEVTIDGKSLDNLVDYRASTPEGGMVFSIPEGSLFNQLGFDAGDRYPAVADGWWIMLPPLSRGEHVIEFAGSGASFSLDVTYNLIVE